MSLVGHKSPQAYHKVTLLTGDCSAFAFAVQYLK